MPRSSGKAPESTHEVQAVVEGADLPTAGFDGRQTVIFLGERYAVADEVAAFAMWKYARAFADDATGMQRLAAEHTLLQECIAPDEWTRFESHAIAKKASDADLRVIANQVLEMLAARPTQRPNDSSTGPQPTSGNSKESSSTGATPSPGIESAGTPPAP